MKKLILAALFGALLSGVALAQGNPPLTVKEVDGNPSKTGISIIEVTNGTLTISGRKATITTGGGGGLTVGTTAIASGTAGRILYETSGNVLGEIAGSSVTAGGQVTFSTANSTTTVNTTTPTAIVDSTGTSSILGFTTSGTIRANVRADNSGNLIFNSTSRAFYFGQDVTAGDTTVYGPSGFYINYTYQGAGAVRIGSVGGGTFQAFSNTHGSFPGQLYFDAGSAANNAVIIRTNGGTEALRADSSQLIGVNKSSSIGAQLHVVSGSASRVGLRVDSASSPSANIAEFTNNATNIFVLNNNGVVTASPIARTSGVNSYFNITTPADTGMTASTESIGIKFGGDASAATVTRTWAAGTTALQREYVFVAPTYATGTFTNSATVAITDAPTVGSGTKYALLVQSGISGLQEIYLGAPTTTGYGFTAAAGYLKARGNLSPGSWSMVWSAATYVGIAAGAQFGWTSNAATADTGSIDTGLVRAGTAGVIRVTNGSTGAGKLIVGTSSASTSAADVYIVGSSASLVPLRVDSASTPSVNVFAVSADNGSTTHFAVTSTGAPSSPGAGTTSERYGASSVAAGTRGVAFGYQASASNTDGLAIGYNPLASGVGSIAMGTNVIASAANSLAIDAGGNLTVSAGNTIAIGASGSSRTMSGQQSVFIGNLASSSISSVVAIGSALPTAANQVVISPGGSANTGGEFVFFGKGVTHATPTAYTINGTGGSGTDIAGAAVNIAGGKGTGTGTGGAVNIQFARAGSTGSSLNSLSTIMAFSGTTTATTATQTNVNGATTIQGQITENITLNTGGTTTDSTIDLPANSIILSVTARVTTTITTATDWEIGDPTTADRFTSPNATLTSGTTDVGINQWKADRTTAGQGPYQASTAKVRITTTGTPGAGVIRITIHYISLSAPTS